MHHRYIALSYQYMFPQGRACELPGNALKIFMVIKSYAPRAFPSIQTISGKANLHRQTVIKYLRFLEDNLFFKRVNRPGYSNCYRINPVLLSNKETREQERWSKQILEKFRPTPGRDPQPQTTNDFNLSKIREVLGGVLKPLPI